jgi:hypothetical protein
MRDALLECGWDAWSCDLLPCEGDPRRHIQADIFKLLSERHRWRLLIAHPECTFLALCGARWEVERPERRRQRFAAYRFARALGDGPLVEDIPHRLLEQPQSRLSTMWRQPDQKIQPWQFGHKKTKSTWIWLHNLPKLRPTRVVGPPPLRMSAAERRSWGEVHHERPGPERKKNRSRSYPGICRAIARQYTEALG